MPRWSIGAHISPTQEPSVTVMRDDIPFTVLSAKASTAKAHGNKKAKRAHVQDCDKAVLDEAHDLARALGVNLGPSNEKSICRAVRVWKMLEEVGKEHGEDVANDKAAAAQAEIDCARGKTKFTFHKKKWNKKQQHQKKAAWKKRS